MPKGNNFNSKIIMKKLKHCLGIFLAMCLLYSCGASKLTPEQQKTYSIEGVNIGVDGTYLVKVSYFAPDLSETSQELAKMYAIKGVLFKGFPSVRGKFSEQYPLVRHRSDMEKYQAFFDSFLSVNGDYARFINQVVDSYTEITKIKRVYEISKIVSISKDDLRKYLEGQGVLKALSDGFEN